jgi:predicted RNase H-like HicB family nuclease
MSLRHAIGIAEPAADGWWISFPIFPGVVTSGRNLTELLVNARDALDSAIAAMEEDGVPIPDGFAPAPGVTALSGYNPEDYRDPRVMLVSVEAGGPAVRINVTMEVGIVVRLDRLADRAHSSCSALLARGSRMVLAAEAAE